MIARWVTTTPHSPAIDEGGITLTYAALDRQVNATVARMRAQGALPGMLIALDLGRSTELVVAMLAAWRLGAAYLPLDPKWPPARRQAILDDARPGLIFGLDVFNDAVGSTPSLSQDPLPHWDTAYVLYTSGSTGAPKGVVVDHAQLLSYVAAATEAMDLGPCRRWALIGSLAADLGYTALFGALYNGACLVIASDEDTQDPESFARFLSLCAIDALKIVPSHLQALLESDSAVLPRKLILGGEATTAALLERIQRAAPSCEIYNHYGPTETTVGVMVHKMGAPTEGEGGLPLTRVLANCQVHLLDSDLQAVPAGAVGEIYIGGAQVCRGYVHGVSDAFVPDPAQPGERLYRTGDLAFRLPEGGLRLAGRVDHQVKIRGYRVEPAEVEAALLRLEGVKQAAVIPRHNTQQEVQLRAFVVCDGTSPPKQRLREALSGVLPSYMLPSHYVFLERFPRLTNGKIDRLALAEWSGGDVGAGESQITAAADPLEQALIGRMALLLGLQGLGGEDDFFERGGHSLLVIKLVAWIQRELGVRIAPDVVFECPTPASLAGALRANGYGAEPMTATSECLS